MEGADLITDILAKLPVKSLLRFNCVSKTWYSIISDPQFCNNLHSMRRPCVLMSESFREFSTIKIESLLGSDDDDDDKPIITPIFLPSQTRQTKKSYRHMILGSCNGLVCLYYHSNGAEQSGLILWNPSTRKFKKLSDPPGLYWINFQPPSCTCVWFGYDELIDDYKLVLLSCEDADCSPPEISKLYVFTLKSNMWRRCAVDHIALGHLTRFFQKYNSYSCHSIGVFSNGSIHWVKPDYIRSGVDTEECILALDLATEKLGLLKFCHSSRFEVYPWIGSLPGPGGGCLCLCTYDYVGCRQSVMALWIMKEYGVESSWTKVLLMKVRGYHPFVKFDPILFSNEGKEIVAISETSNYQAKMVKLRVSGEKLRSEKVLLRLKKGHSENNVFLHMEESLVSLN